MVDLERYLGTYLTMLVHSYNPDTYVRLMEKKWRTFVKFFLLTLGLALLLFVLTFIPMALQWIGHLPETLGEVDAFSVSGNISADHPVELIEVPHTVLDVSDTGADAKFLFTEEGVHYPTFFYFGESFVAWGELTDLKQQTESRDRMLVLIVLFLLPSILFWVSLWSILKLLLVFLLLVMSGFTFPRFLGYRLTFPETMKAAVLCMPSVMLFGVGLSPLAPRPLWWWGLALTAGLFCICVFLLSERPKRGKV